MIFESYFLTLGVVNVINCWVLVQRKVYGFVLAGIAIVHSVWLFYAA